MTDSPPVCHIVGAGRAGAALARAMACAGYSFGWVGSRNAADAERLAAAIGAIHWGIGFEGVDGKADAIILAVPDSAIASVAEEAALSGVVKPDVTVAAHLSGSLGVEALAPLSNIGASVMAFHPCQTFAPDTGADPVFNGVIIDMEGDDRACEFGARVARDIGAAPMRFGSGQRNVTHLAMTVASNYTVTILSMALDLIDSAGVPEESARKMLMPLVYTTVDNVFGRGIGEALTGPVARGDADIVGRHLEILAAMNGDYLEAYRALAIVALKCAVERGEIAEDAVRKMECLLKKRC